MIDSTLAICAGYVAGQAACHKFLLSKVPDSLEFVITVSIILLFQIGANFFLGTDEIINLEIVLSILTGCGIGQSIVLFLFKE